jgi:hypothetical protein
VPGTAQNTEQRPYRGMQSFSEQHKDLFFGRTKPVDEIFSLLKNNLLTVIFGKSGIGKSSLISAGLMPKLRENFYLPVLIRIPFSDFKIDPLAYTQSCVEAEIRKYIFKDFVYPKDISLWQFFREANYTGGVVIPVLIFDQFEEYFSFGKQNKQRSEKFIKELSDLIENRMPEQLANTDNYKILTSTDTQSIFRVIISLREDFLAQLEDLSKLIPSLNKIRYRIMQLHGEEAFEAVYFPAKNLIDETTAIHLLKKIIPKKIHAEADKEPTVTIAEDDWKEKDFEPYILSLFCYQANEKRINARQNKISEALINQTKVETILNDYYTSSLKKYSRRYHKHIAHVLEKNLISDEGYRLLKPVNAKEFKNISPQAINDMVDDRIIHRETRNDISYIEISHDLLAKVIYEKKIESRTNKRSIIIAASIITLVAILVGLGFFKQREAYNSALYKQKVSSIKAKDSAVKVILLSKDSAILKNDSLTDKINKTQQTINQTHDGTIYFQVNVDPNSQQSLTDCMKRLKEMNFLVPSPEIIANRQFENMVRYFHPEDSVAAKKIKAVCDHYYSSPFNKQYVGYYGKKVAKGTLEVWVYYQPGLQNY